MRRGRGYAGFEDDDERKDDAGAGRRALVRLAARAGARDPRGRDRPQTAVAEDGDTKRTAVGACAGRVAPPAGRKGPPPRAARATHAPEGLQQVWRGPNAAERGRAKKPGWFTSYDGACRQGEPGL